MKVENIKKIDAISTNEFLSDYVKGYMRMPEFADIVVHGKEARLESVERMREIFGRIGYDVVPENEIFCIIYSISNRAMKLA